MGETFFHRDIADKQYNMPGYVTGQTYTSCVYFDCRKYKKDLASMTQRGSNKCCHVHGNYPSNEEPRLHRVYTFVTDLCLIDVDPRGFKEWY